MYITVQSSDGTKFRANQTTLVRNERNGVFSNTLANLLQDAPLDEDEPVCFDRITTAAMRKVIEFAKLAEQHKCPDLPQKLEERVRVQLFDWQIEWMNTLKEFREDKDVMTLVADVLAAANYLDIPSLIFVTQKLGSELLRGKDMREICQTCGIKEKSTKEQREIIMNENPCLRPEKNKQ